MKIELKLYASLERYSLDSSAGKPSTVEISAGTTITGLLKQLKLPPDAIKIIFLNGVHAKESEILKDGDRLGVFPPVAGG